MEYVTIDTIIACWTLSPFRIKANRIFNGINVTLQGKTPCINNNLHCLHVYKRASVIHVSFCSWCMTCLYFVQGLLSERISKAGSHHTTICCIMRSAEDTTF